MKLAIAVIWVIVAVVVGLAIGSGVSAWLNHAFDITPITGTR